ncbi:MAG: V-type ATP synthase subunit F [Firmicutes bacterium]|nr:V-type ATP synthase subunit F [Bacillota bacterium]
MEANKIGIIGERGSVLGFLAAGFSVYIADGKNEGAIQLKKAANEGCAVIFITEDLAEALEDEIAEYACAPVPAVVAIPGGKGGRGYGLASIRRAAESAVGADILFRE